jgi:hypothetical protein
MVRFEIGFRGGGSTGGVVSEAEWGKLDAALRAGASTTVELQGPDQRWLVRADEVAWARRHEGGRRLGFTQ